MCAEPNAQSLDALFVRFVVKSVVEPFFLIFQRDFK